MLRTVLDIFVCDILTWKACHAQLSNTFAKLGSFGKNEEIQFSGVEVN
jgi:hypothetical protein